MTWKWVELTQFHQHIGIAQHGTKPFTGTRMDVPCVPSVIVGTQHLIRMEPILKHLVYMAHRSQ